MRVHKDFSDVLDEFTEKHDLSYMDASKELAHEIKRLGLI